MGIATLRYLRPAADGLGRSRWIRPGSGRWWLSRSAGGARPGSELLVVAAVHGKEALLPLDRPRAGAGGCWGALDLGRRGLVIAGEEGVVLVGRCCAREREEAA